jgi:hypothetical protein
MSTINPVEQMPCIFCGYRGAGYWQRGTHHEDCPWHMIGGKQERLAKLPQLLKKLFSLATAAVEYIDEVPCDPDITENQMDAYAIYQDALTDMNDLS